MSFRSFIMVLTLGAVCGCANASDQERRDAWVEEFYPGDFSAAYNVKDGEYHVDGVTPAGVQYDSGGLPVDEEKLDHVIASTEGCLRNAFPDGEVPEKMLPYAQCDPFGKVVIPGKSDFVVILSNYWRWSCEGREQVLGVKIPDDQGCLDKGQTPTEECPCGSRGASRRASDGMLLLIVTPSMFMLGDVMTRTFTACANPWWGEEVKPLTECATPVVPADPEREWKAVE